MSLLNFKAPMNATLSVGPDPLAGNALRVKTGASGNVELTGGDGSLSAYAGVDIGVYSKEAEVEIMSWRGFNAPAVLWNQPEKRIPIPGFGQSIWNQWAAMR